VSGITDQGKLAVVVAPLVNGIDLSEGPLGAVGLVDVHEAKKGLVPVGKVLAELREVGRLGSVHDLAVLLHAADDDDVEDIILEKVGDSVGIGTDPDINTRLGGDLV